MNQIDVLAYGWLISRASLAEQLGHAATARRLRHAAEMILTDAKQQERLPATPAD